MNRRPLVEHKNRVLNADSADELADQPLRICCLCRESWGQTFSRRDLPEHVNVESLVGHQLLQPGVFGLEFFEPIGVVGLHAAVLGKPAMPGRLSDL
jgi:hypothetical protein